MGIFANKNNRAKKRYLSFSNNKLNVFSFEDDDVHICEYNEVGSSVPKIFFGFSLFCLFLIIFLFVLFSSFLLFFFFFFIPNETKSARFSTRQRQHQHTQRKNNNKRKNQIDQIIIKIKMQGARQSDVFFGERESGQDVRQSNVTAVQAVANIVKSSLGPVGLDKVF